MLDSSEVAGNLSDDGVNSFSGACSASRLVRASFACRGFSGVVGLWPDAARVGISRDSGRRRGRVSHLKGGRNMQNCAWQFTRAQLGVNTQQLGKESNEPSTELNSSTGALLLPCGRP